MKWIEDANDPDSMYASDDRLCRGYVMKVPGDKFRAYFHNDPCMPRYFDSMEDAKNWIAVKYTQWKLDD